MSEDVHSRYISELESADDWAGLIRYWLGHGLYAPAVVSAIELLRRRGKDEIATWLEERSAEPRVSAARRLEDIVQQMPLRDGLSPNEFNTLGIVALFPLLCLCEAGSQYPLESRNDYIRMGLNAAVEFAEIAGILDDEPLSALSAEMVAFAYQELGAWDVAIEPFKMALEVRRQLASARPEIYRPEIGRTLNNLGHTLMQSQQLEDAFPIFEEATELYRQLSDDYVHELAKSLSNAGAALSELGRIDEAAKHLSEAREKFEHLADRHPAVFNPLANTLINEANCLQKARSFSEAKTKYSKAGHMFRELGTGHEHLLAMTLLNRGLLEKELCQLEQAEASIGEGLNIYSDLANEQPDQFYPLVAQSLNSLGVVKRDFERHESAAQAFQQALSIYQELADRHPEMYRRHLAAAWNNVATSLHSQELLRETDNAFAESIEIYRDLAEQQPELYKLDLAMTQSNRAMVLNDLGQRIAARELMNEAYSLLQELCQREPDVHLPHVGMMLSNMARIDALHGTEEAIVESLQSAAMLYEEAVRVYDKIGEHGSTSRLAQQVNTRRSLANLLLTENPAVGWPNYTRARELLRTACEAGEMLRGMFGNPIERIRAQQNMLATYFQRLRLLLEIGHQQSDLSAFNEALETAEASRSRNLLDLLEEQRVPEQAPPEVAAEFRKLNKALRYAQRRLHLEFETLEALSRETVGEEPLDEGAFTESARTQRCLRYPPRLALDLESRTGQADRMTAILQYIDGRISPYRRLCEDLSEFDSSFQPDRVARVFSVDQLGELFPSDKLTAFVHLEMLDPVWHATVVLPERLLPIRLEGLGAPDLLNIINAMVMAQASSQMLEAAIPEATNALAATILDDLMPVLEQAGVEAGDRIVFVPTGPMSFLPLHAMPLGEGETLGDRYEVAYTPSLSVLQHCLNRKREEPTRLFGVVDPTRDLPHTTLEAALVKQHFTDTNLLTTTTLEEFLEQAADAHVCYWMGHAQFSVRVPYWSGLVHQMTGREETKEGIACFVQAPQDVITFTDIDTALQMDHCTLAVLSGCQSGLALTGKGNEYVSLVTAFLNAGAKCVLASLWPVDDRACMLTMQRFMRAWREDGQTIAAALKTAQQWLRELTAEQLVQWCQQAEATTASTQLQKLTWWAEELVKVHGPNHQPFSSPYHYAPFVAVGQAWK